MKWKSSHIALCIILLFGACEEPFTPDLSDVEPRYVVEAHVEAGKDTRIAPAYAILSYSMPFYADINREAIEELFIHDAAVEMINGVDTVQLEELCLSDLPASVRAEIIRQLNVETFDSVMLDFCIYIDAHNELEVEEGDTVELNIRVNKDSLYARTTLPYSVPIDSFDFQPAPNPEILDYKSLVGYLTDPADVANYYRIKISVNGSRYLPGFVSVVEDKIFNGKSFDFPISSPIQPDEEMDPALYGLFHDGDTVSIQWMSIDKAHYDFWSSLEYSQGNQGPFSSYTRVRGNVEGALGVFGGYSTRFYDFIIPTD